MELRKIGEGQFCSMLVARKLKDIDITNVRIHRTIG